MEKFIRRSQSWLLGGLFLLVIVELIIMVPKEVNQPQVEVMPEEIPDEAQQSMSGIHVMETESESKEWELWADKAFGFQESGDMEMENVKAIFFGADGSEFVVTGEKGSVVALTKNMHVHGDVLTKSSNGYVFRSKNLTYDSKQKKLITEASVQVRGPREASGNRVSIAGVGMSTDLKAGEMSILSNVKARKTLPQTGPMSVDSQQAKLSSSKRAIQFSGDVIMDFGGVRVTGPDAKFLYGDSRLKGVELEGGIRVSDWNKWATSDRVNIDLEKNKYVFNGRPRVVQDDDELMGDEIIFLNGGKKVKVKNAKVRVGKERFEQYK